VKKCERRIIKRESAWCREKEKTRRNGVGNWDWEENILIS
jgi:hypothetical protein